MTRDPVKKKATYRRYYHNHKETILAKKKRSRITYHSLADKIWLWDYNRNAIVEFVWGFPESKDVVTRFVYGGDAVGFYEVSSVDSEILGVIGTEGVML